MNGGTLNRAIRYISNYCTTHKYVIRNGKGEPGPNTGGGRSGIILLF